MELITIIATLIWLVIGVLVLVTWILETISKALNQEPNDDDDDFPHSPPPGLVEEDELTRQALAAEPQR